MWYNLDNIRGRLDDIYIIKLVERRKTMKYFKLKRMENGKIKCQAIPFEEYDFVTDGFGGNYEGYEYIEASNYKQAIEYFKMIEEMPEGFEFEEDGIWEMVK